jgi:hypothetical protein
MSSPARRSEDDDDAGRSRKRQRAGGSGGGGGGGGDDDGDDEGDDAAPDSPSSSGRRSVPASPDSDASEQNNSDSEGEDLIENAEDDYQAMGVLDQYDQAEIDNREYDPIDQDTRRAAEQALDRQSGRGGRLDEAFQDDDELEQDDSHRQRGQEDDEIVLEQMEGNLREWIATEQTRKAIMSRFEQFLKTFLDGNGNNVHQEKIHTMCGSNQQSLMVSYLDLR